MIHRIGFSIFCCYTASVPFYLGTVCKIKCASFILPVGYVESGSVFSNDRSFCLIASSVKSMICSRSCYCIKSSCIKLTMWILLFWRACISSCIYAFCCPVLTPGKSCIYVLILACQLVRIGKCFRHFIAFCEILFPCRELVCFLCCIFLLDILCLVCSSFWHCCILCCFFCYVCSILYSFFCYSFSILCRFLCAKILRISCLCLGNHGCIKIRCHYSGRKGCCCHCKT